MSKPAQTRRRFLAGTAGTALVLGLAGCTTGGGSGSGPTPGEGTQTDNHDEGGEHSTEDDHEEEHTDGDGHSTEDDHEEEHTAGDDHSTEDGHHDEETPQEGDGHGHNHDEGTPEGPASSARVTMRTEGSQHHYDPHMVWVEPGATVTWELESGQHNAVAYHPDNDKPLRIPEGGEPWETELLSEQGATASHTFEAEGVYDYYCAPHEGLGMVGTVVVGEPDAHGQPALAEPQTSLPEGARRELADLGEQTNEALGHTH
jgi:plastocyanin